MANRYKPLEKAIEMTMNSILWLVLWAGVATVGCDSNLEVRTVENSTVDLSANKESILPTVTSSKLTSEDCVDPNLNEVLTSVSLTLCNGELASGLLDLSELRPENILTGVSIAGVSGTSIPTPADCASDGATACVANVSFKAADMSQVVDSNIKLNVSIAGVAGSYSGGAYNACSADGESGCITSASFLAADMSSVASGNIRSGVTVAGWRGRRVAMLSRDDQ